MNICGEQFVVDLREVSAEDIELLQKLLFKVGFHWAGGHSTDTKSGLKALYLNDYRQSHRLTCRTGVDGGFFKDLSSGEYVELSYQHVREILLDFLASGSS